MRLKKNTALLKTPAVKQGIVVLFDQGLMSLVTLIAGIIIARTSTAEDYALYMLGWTVLNSIKGIHEALVNLPFTVHAPRFAGAEFRLYQGSTLIHTSIFCIASGLVLFGLGCLNAYHVININLKLFEIAPVLLFLLCAVSFRDYLRNALLAQLKVLESVRINASISILLVILMAVFYKLNHLTYTDTYLLFSLTYCFGAAMMFWQHKSKYRINISLLWSHFRKNWGVGKWALFGNFAYIGSRLSYPWLILYFLDYESVAAYYACLAVAVAPGPILRGTGAYVLPRMSHGFKQGSMQNLTRLLRKSILLLCIPYLLWLLAGSFFSKEIIELFYAKKYSGYESLLVFLLIMTTIDFVFAPLTNALQVLEKTRAITTSLIIGAFVTLSFGSALINQFGLQGAGIAAILSMASTVAWRVLVFIKNVNRQNSCSQDSQV